MFENLWQLIKVTIAIVKTLLGVSTQLFSKLRFQYFIQSSFGWFTAHHGFWWNVLNSARMLIDEVESKLNKKDFTVGAKSQSTYNQRSISGKTVKLKFSSFAFWINRLNFEKIWCWSFPTRESKKTVFV